MLKLIYIFNLLLVLGIFVSRTSAGTFSIDNTTHQFLKDGKPFQYLSGSIHYMRVHPELWNDRLQRIRALGLNAIQVYVPWNLHEPSEGTFDFSGGLNLTRFLTLAQQNNLYVLLRPGPYICSEWEFGGLPYWLLKYDEIELRTYDPIYIKAVQNYFNVLLDIVQPFLYKNGGPILMVQIENEFGYALSCNHTYTNFLRDLVWNKLGNDIVLYTVDGYKQDVCLSCGSVPGALTTIDFGITNDTSALDYYFSQQDKYNNGGPHVVSEFRITWVVDWFQTQQQLANTTNVVANLAHMFYNLNTSINVYMIHGGTNFGFMNGGNAATSYDYGAAIAENGDATYVYMAIRSFIQNIPKWEQPPLDIPNNNTALNYGQVVLRRIGSNLISTLTQIQEPCVQSQDPLNFEQINHGYGYVLYTTTVTSGGTHLSTPNIKDFGYVFVNNIYQGFVTVDGNISLSIAAQPGDSLRILVENKGRYNAGAYVYNQLDRKGLMKNVTLDGKNLQNWFQCGINLTKDSVDSLITTFDKNYENWTPEKAQLQPGVYVGQFTASQLEDTFFDSTGWGKGQLFINGYNVGRYWPTAGPQITLYVPKPYIQQTNTVLLIELEGAQQNYVNFVDHAIYNYTSINYNGRYRH